MTNTTTFHATWSWDENDQGFAILVINDTGALVDSTFVAFGIDSALADLGFRRTAAWDVDNDDNFGTAPVARV